MNSFLSKVIRPKKQWRAMEARAAALPSDHRIVYGEMKSYMWRASLKPHHGREARRIASC